MRNSMQSTHMQTGPLPSCWQQSRMCWWRCTDTLLHGWWREDYLSTGSPQQGCSLDLTLCLILSHPPPTCRCINNITIIIIKHNTFCFCWGVTSQLRPVSKRRKLIFNIWKTSRKHPTRTHVVENVITLLLLMNDYTEMQMQPIQ